MTCVLSCEEGMLKKALQDCDCSRLKEIGSTLSNYMSENEIRSPEDLYCGIGDLLYSLKISVTDEECDIICKKLFKNLVHYGVIKDPNQVRKDILSKLKINMICMGQWTKDSQWYSCTINKITKNQVHVTYIDYGNSEYLDPIRIKLSMKNKRQDMLIQLQKQLCLKQQRINELEKEKSKYEDWYHKINEIENLKQQNNDLKQKNDILKQDNNNLKEQFGGVQRELNEFFYRNSHLNDQIMKYEELIIQHQITVEKYEQRFRDQEIVLRNAEKCLDEKNEMLKNLGEGSDIESFKQKLEKFQSLHLHDTSNDELYDIIQLLQKSRKRIDEHLSKNFQRLRCAICLDREKQIFFEPCGHICCCSTCSTRISQCPICKTNIRKKQKCYM